jgi:hypothetical protein
MTGKSDSGYAMWDPADSGTSKDILTVRDEVTLEIKDITITYDGASTTSADVKLYDDTEGTAAGQLSNQIGLYKIPSGGKLALQGINREEVENDIVGVVHNNDDDISVVVGAEQTT